MPVTKKTSSRKKLATKATLDKLFEPKKIHSREKSAIEVFATGFALTAIVVLGYAMVFVK